MAYRTRGTRELESEDSNSEQDSVTSNDYKDSLYTVLAEKKLRIKTGSYKRILYQELMTTPVMRRAEQKSYKL